MRVVAITAAVAVVSSVSIVAIAVNGLASTVQANTVALSNEADVPQLVDVGAIEGGVNVLVVGSDTRINQLSTEGDDTEGARNDVTMLLHISQDHQNVSVISFPRDTMVDMAKCTDPDTGEVYGATSYQQLNTALGRGGQRGGLGCVVATVEQITGLKIPYAGVISFDGVAAMTSVIGGVDVCISKPIDDPYSNLHLGAGNQTLSGEDALAFLRTREGVGDGSDLARISSQQVYLSALVRKILSDGTLTNPVTLYGLANAALSNMFLSTELGKVDSMVSIAKALQGVQLDKVAFLRYPVSGDPDDPNRVVVNEADSDILNAALASDTPLDLSQVGTADSATSADGTGDTPTGDPATEAPTDPAADPAATTAPDAGGATVLPDSFTGQTAAKVTCSVGN
ncbi:LytR family transcriptional regulator [Clavibacter michiganensis]|nr:LCP family protein [Clavibacter michiganensis]PPF60999.1 LytR family transcriptional regulator [Clavibacter michiganensis]